MTDPKGTPVVTDEMVTRFLSWRLPGSVHPDGQYPVRDAPYPMSGTNLLDHGEARAMLEHVVGSDISRMRDEIFRLRVLEAAVRQERDLLSTAMDGIARSIPAVAQPEDKSPPAQQTAGAGDRGEAVAPFGYVDQLVTEHFQDANETCLINNFRRNKTDIPLYTTPPASLAVETVRSFIEDECEQWHGREKYTVRRALSRLLAAIEGEVR